MMESINKPLADGNTNVADNSEVGRHSESKVTDEVKPMVKQKESQETDLVEQFVQFIRSTSQSVSEPVPTEEKKATQASGISSGVIGDFQNPASSSGYKLGNENFPTESEKPDEEVAPSPFKDVEVEPGSAVNISPGRGQENNVSFTGARTEPLLQVCQTSEDDGDITIIEPEDVASSTQKDNAGVSIPEQKPETQSQEKNTDIQVTKEQAYGTGSSAEKTHPSNYNKYWLNILQSGSKFQDISCFNIPPPQKSAPQELKETVSSASQLIHQGQGSTPSPGTNTLSLQVSGDNIAGLSLSSTGHLASGEKETVSDTRALVVPPMPLIVSKPSSSTSPSAAVVQGKSSVQTSTPIPKSYHKQNSLVLKCNIVNNAYVCETCGAQTKDRRLFYVHVWGHLHKNYLRCTHCNFPTLVSGNIPVCSLITNMLASLDMEKNRRNATKLVEVNNADLPQIRNNRAIDAIKNAMSVADAIKVNFVIPKQSPSLPTVPKSSQPMTDAISVTGNRLHGQQQTSDQSKTVTGKQNSGIADTSEPVAIDLSVDSDEEEGRLVIAEVDSEVERQKNDQQTSSKEVEAIPPSTEVVVTSGRDVSSVTDSGLHTESQPVSETTIVTPSPQKENNDGLPIIAATYSLNGADFGSKAEQNELTDSDTIQTPILGSATDLSHQQQWDKETTNSEENGLPDLVEEHIDVVSHDSTNQCQSLRELFQNSKISQGLLETPPDLDKGPRIMKRAEREMQGYGDSNFVQLISGKSSGMTSGRPATTTEKVSSHNTLGFYQCGFTQCAFFTDDVDGFKMHLRIKHSSNLYPCAYCDTTCDTDDKIITHMKQHMKRMTKRLYQCSFPGCKFGSDSVVAYKAHCNSQHPNMSASCYYCKMEFNTLEDLVNHLTASTVKLIECPYCKLVSQSKKTLITHISTEHPAEARKIVVSTFISCIQKRPKILKYKPPQAEVMKEQKEKVEKTMKNDAGMDSTPNAVEAEKNLKCQHCPFKCSSQSILSSHEDMHATKSFICTLCMYGANSQESFKSHMSALHPDQMNIRIRIYVCQVCSFQANHEIILDHHFDNLHPADEVRYEVVKRLFNSKPVSTSSSTNVCTPPAPRGVSSGGINQDPRPTVKEMASRGSRVLEADVSKEFLSNCQRFLCPLCLFNTDLIKGFRRHMSQHKFVDGSKPFITMYACKSCRYSSTQKELIERHIKKQHPTGVVTIGSSPLFIGHSPSSQKTGMDPDGSSQASEMEALLQESGISVIDKYHCEICSFSATSKDLLKQHMVKHNTSRTSQKKTKSNITKDQERLIENQDYVTICVKRTVYQCHECEHYKTRAQPVLFSHLSYTHGIQKPEYGFHYSSCEEAGSLYRCMRCNIHVDYQSKGMLTNHFKGNHQEFLERPPAAQKPVHEKPLPISSSNEGLPTVGTKDHTTSSGEVFCVPQESVFKMQIACPMCEFRSKVRYNLLRHFKKAHQMEKNSNGHWVIPTKDGKTGSLQVVSVCNEDNENCEIKDDSQPTASLSQTEEKGKEQENWKLVDKDLYQCLLCEFQNRRPDKMRRHFNYVHAGLKPYHCMHCEYSSAEGAKVARHCKNQHPTKGCKIFRFTDDESNTESKGLIQFKCLHCRFHSNTKEDVAKHSENVHVGQPVKVLQGYEVTVGEDALQPEKSQPQVEFLASDSVHCGFKRVEPYLLQCDLCSYQSEYITAMKRHVLTIHYKIKPFMCGYCKWSHAEKFMLLQHMQKYHKDKPPLTIRVNVKEVVKGQVFKIVAETRGASETESVSRSPSVTQTETQPHSAGLPEPVSSALPSDDQTEIKTNSFLGNENVATSSESPFTDNTKETSAAELSGDDLQSSALTSINENDTDANQTPSPLKDQSTSVPEFVIKDSLIKIKAEPQDLEQWRENENILESLQNYAGGTYTTKSKGENVTVRQVKIYRCLYCDYYSFYNRAHVLRHTRTWHLDLLMGLEHKPDDTNEEVQQQKEEAGKRNDPGNDENCSGEVDFSKVTNQTESIMDDSTNNEVTVQETVEQNKGPVADSIGDEAKLEAQQVIQSEEAQINKSPQSTSASIPDLAKDLTKASKDADADVEYNELYSSKLVIDTSDAPDLGSMELSKKDEESNVGKLAKCTSDTGADDLPSNTFAKELQATTADGNSQTVSTNAKVPETNLGKETSIDAVLDELSDHTYLDSSKIAEVPIQQDDKEQRSQLVSGQGKRDTIQSGSAEDPNYTVYTSNINSVGAEAEMPANGQALHEEGNANMPSVEMKKATAEIPDVKLDSTQTSVISEKEETISELVDKLISTAVELGEQKEVENNPVETNTGGFKQPLGVTPTISKDATAVEENSQQKQTECSSTAMDIGYHTLEAESTAAIENIPTCQICGYASSSKSSVQSHLEKHLPSMYKIEYISKSPGKDISARDLVSHMPKARLELSPRRNKSPKSASKPKFHDDREAVSPAMFYCMFCAYKTRHTKSDVIKHTKTQHMQYLMGLGSKTYGGKISKHSTPLETMDQPVAPNISMQLDAVVTPTENGNIVGSNEETVNLAEFAKENSPNSAGSPGATCLNEENGYKDEKRMCRLCQFSSQSIASIKKHITTHLQDLVSSTQFKGETNISPLFNLSLISDGQKAGAAPNSDASMQLQAEAAPNSDASVELKADAQPNSDASVELNAATNDCSETQAILEQPECFSPSSGAKAFSPGFWKGKITKCLYCDYKSDHRHNTMRHVRSKHMYALMGFPQIDSMLTNSPSDVERKNTMVKEQKDKIPVCTICNYSTKAPILMRTHITTYHIPTLYEIVDTQQLTAVNSTRSDDTQKTEALDDSLSTNDNVESETQDQPSNLMEVDQMSTRISSSEVSKHGQASPSAHKGKKIFRCLYCEYQSMYGRIDVLRHSIKHHVDFLMRSISPEVECKVKVENADKNDEVSHSTTKFKCQICDYVSENEDKMYLHLKDNHLQSFYAVEHNKRGNVSLAGSSPTKGTTSPLKGATSPSKGSRLKAHQGGSSPGCRIFRCMYCDYYSFYGRQDVIRHTQKIHMSFLMGVAGSCTTSKAVSDGSIEAENEEMGNTKFTCQVCLFSTEDRAFMQDHIQAEHIMSLYIVEKGQNRVRQKKNSFSTVNSSKIQKISTPTGKPALKQPPTQRAYKCVYCSYTSVYCSADIYRHTLNKHFGKIAEKLTTSTNTSEVGPTVDEDVSYKCKRCNSIFDSKQSVRYHMKFHRSTFYKSIKTTNPKHTNATNSGSIPFNSNDESVLEYTGNDKSEWFYKEKRPKEAAALSSVPEEKKEQVIWACSYCDFTTPSNRTVSRHKRSFHDKGSSSNRVEWFSASCPFCPHTAAGGKLPYEKRQEYMRNHIRRVHMEGGEDEGITLFKRSQQSNNFECFLCGYSTPASRGIVRIISHLKVAHPNLLNTSYKCMFCSYSRRQLKLLKLHMKTKHRGKALRFLKITGQCEIDNGKNAHTDVKSNSFIGNSDSEVGVEFTPKVKEPGKPRLARGEDIDALLSSHKETLKKSPGSLHACPICSKTFNSRDTLHKHCKRHSSFRPFKCGYCSFKAFSRYSIRIHSINMHKGKELKIKQLVEPSKPEANIKATNNIAVGPPSLSSAPLSQSQEEKSAEKVLHCSMCPYTTKNSKNMKEHKYIHYNHRPYTCGHCPYRGRTLEAANKHHAENHPGMPTEISYVKTSLLSKLADELKNIQKSEKANKEGVQLKDLTEQSGSSAGETRAGVKVTRNEDGMYYCPLCDFKSGYHSSIGRHVMQIHPENSPRSASIPAQRRPSSSEVSSVKSDTENHDSKGAQYVCSLCKESFPRIDRARWHVMRHLSYYPMRCSECDHRCQTTNGMNNHIQKQHNGKGTLVFDQDLQKEDLVKRNITETQSKKLVSLYTYVCRHCHHSTTRRENFKTHTMQHFGYKPYSCGICKTQFCTKSNTEKHAARFHEGKDPVVIEKKNTSKWKQVLEEVDRCKKLDSNTYQGSKMGAAVPKSPSATLGLPLGVKPFVCKLCGYKTRKGSKLKAHRAGHGKSATYQCAYCNERHDKFRILKEHLVAIHPQLTCAIRVVAAKKTITSNTSSQLLNKQAALDNTPEDSSEESSEDDSSTVISSTTGASVSTASTVDDLPSADKPKKKRIRPKQPPPKSHLYFYCTECPVRMRTDHVQFHVNRSHLGYEPYKCALCSCTTCTRPLMHLHFRQKHKGLISKYTYRIDKQKEADMKKMVDHIKQGKKIEVEVGSPRLQFFCQICAYSVKRLDVLRHHYMSSHLNYNPVRCGYCSRESSSERMLDRHFEKSHFGRKKLIKYQKKKDLETLLDEFMENATTPRSVSSDSKRKVAVQTMLNIAHAIESEPDKQTKTPSFDENQAVNFSSESPPAKKNKLDEEVDHLHSKAKSLVREKTTGVPNGSRKRPRPEDEGHLLPLAKIKKEELAGIERPPPLSFHSQVEKCTLNNYEMELPFTPKGAERLYHCPLTVCSYVTQIIGHMKHHAWVHYGGRYLCGICGIVNSQKPKIKHHIEVDHYGKDAEENIAVRNPKVTNLYYCCHLCAYATMDKTTFSEHFSTVHWPKHGHCSFDLKVVLKDCMQEYAEQGDYSMSRSPALSDDCESLSVDVGHAIGDFLQEQGLEDGEEDIETLVSAVSSKGTQLPTAKKRPFHSKFPVSLKFKKPQPKLKTNKGKNVCKKSTGAGFTKTKQNQRNLFDDIGSLETQPVMSGNHLSQGQNHGSLEKSPSSNPGNSVNAIKIKSEPLDAFSLLSQTVPSSSSVNDVPSQVTVKTEPTSDSQGECSFDEESEDWLVLDSI
ncbi:uncharacterized protein LOC106171239 isoform X2 [Lingula anatina]|uniref:Uncharacterized protein LOC106171239 isoform X2 n=1 Tax=Lingula anatina TaxID=7574 RepID=A0A2R2MIC3_LINAN|nr:uncharacterized protein LOC106171239 isoform X2 [Lingula anatina]|eukprot:XP_023929949.1 uncharacterized protein LOC106171239 isoform X2 [Lingula anatina]